MSDSELLEKLYRTWVQALINDYWNDYAAIIVDAELEFDVEWSEYYSCSYNSGIIVYLLLNLRLIVSNSEEIQQILRHYFVSIAGGHIWNDIINFPIRYRVKLLEVEENWQKTIKFLIAK